MPDLSPDRIAPDIDFRRDFADLFDVAGKVFFLPGGYGGIGEAAAWALAMRGAKVAIAGRSGDKAATLAESLRTEGFDALGLAHGYDRCQPDPRCDRCGGWNVSGASTDWSI